MIIFFQNQKGDSTWSLINPEKFIIDIGITQSGNISLNLRTSGFEQAYYNMDAYNLLAEMEDHLPLKTQLDYAPMMETFEKRLGIEKEQKEN